MNANLEGIDMVVNYFQIENEDDVILANTGKALSLLRADENVQSIYLIDGSPESFPQIKKICKENHATYIHRDRQLGFAEGYNVGISLSESRYVGLMANDIIPWPGTMNVLMNWIKKDDVGCVFPYLTESDYPTQVARESSNTLSCEPAGMTLNLNVFKRSVLDSVGGVHEGFTGAFNDVILLLGIRDLGWRVVMAGETCVGHIGMMTTKSGKTDKNFINDFANFKKDYPMYSTKRGLWKVAFWKKPFSMNPTMQLLWLLAQYLPSYRMRKRIERLILKWEPLLTRIKQ